MLTVSTFISELRGNLGNRLLNPSNAEHNDTKIFENHLNPVMLVFIG